MKKIKISTIIRIVALLAVLINQVLAIFGKNLPFNDNLVYQIVSAVLTVAVSAWTAWKNNDFTKLARAAGAVLDALKDGKITTDEVENIVNSFSDSTEETTETVTDDSKTE